ncbi:facilitated trehalose transporter Tret1-2 homolog [Parasteatoda tepidariorum]|uniref:facilitated trehalose transporter Tret1-2 homolog n=1 Tax=Parasteatoda tepidariorum TaxID=114398 RepID=UPI00077F9AC9|nr:facilitated trehalose transporter Tret1-2 homolog [Parasteatoda tepidariorum]
MSEMPTLSNTKVFANAMGKSAETLLPAVSLTNIRLAAASALLYAVVLGVITSYSAPATADMKRPGSRFSDVTPDEITWIGSLPNLGCLFGNLIAGYATHEFGRKTVMMFVSIFYLTSWLMVAYAPSMMWMYCGRLIGGICAGACCVAVPTYIIEIAPTKIRGQLASGFQIAYTIGVLYVMGLGIFLRWSWLAISGAVIVACASCLMVFMPESPPWLVRASRPLEAENGLRFLKGPSTDTQRELQSIMDNIAENKEEGIRLEELLLPEIYKPTAIALALMFFQQACGISPLMTYTVEIFHSAGSSIDPAVAATIVALVQVIATVLSGSLMDRSGRRCLFVTSGSIMFISLAVLGSYSFKLNQYLVSYHFVGYIPLISFATYIIAFSLGNGPIPYVMIPEIVPIKFRSPVVAAAGVLCSLLAFVFNKIFEDMRQGLGDYGVYWTYSFFSLISALFGFFILPETKGLTMRQISKSFSHSEKK